MSTSIKAYVFDVYGTLFDVYSVKKVCEDLYPGKGEEISVLWRQKQLEYSFLRQLMGHYTTFYQVTKDSLRFSLEKLHLPFSPKQEQQLIEEYRRLSLHPEVKNVVEQLSDKQRAVFSNGSRDMLEPLIHQSAISGTFDAIISVDDIKQYKPTPASYFHAMKALKLERDEVLFISSNGWDISGARAFGFKTAWINRSSQPNEHLDLQPHATYNDLTGILEWL
ncbi:haloacid dehalogenase type II [Halalkalibacter urbisdiaboli]|uniref:haloacid dehalogenase type II n=1 Tax=Halalkalibacter urbisdiaboli TaxID=1960589 RepID=UPI000B43F0E4|nr:haloacid dehalogenase type II [Halalkalibacter urbisdiaboli]